MSVPVARCCFEEVVLGQLAVVGEVEGSKMKLEYCSAVAQRYGLGVYEAEIVVE